MSVTMVRQRVKDGCVDEAEAAARQLFATLQQVRPDGLRYASTRVQGGSTFVILLELVSDVGDPRADIPAFQRFQERLEGWVEGPPVIERLEVVGSYELFRGDNGQRVAST